MFGRYEVQYTNLHEIIRKSQVNWYPVRRYWRLKTAQKKFWELASANTEATLYRVYDRVAEKAVF